MAANPKSKEIQVQKPAQSLQAFQQKLAQGQEDHTTLLKPVLIGVGAVLVVSLSIFGFRSYRASTLDKHEAAMAKLMTEVHGDGQVPAPAAEQEKRMREKLPQLEKLVADAPSSAKTVAQNTLAEWKLQLDGKAPAAAQPSDEWDRIRLAQRQIALGQAADATSTLASLQKKAGPDAAWSSAYWNTLMELHRLKGDREQALKDYAEYKAKFKEGADSSLDRVLASI